MPIDASKYEIWNQNKDVYDRKQTLVEPRDVSDLRRRLEEIERARSTGTTPEPDRTSRRDR